LIPAPAGADVYEPIPAAEIKIKKGGTRAEPPLSGIILLLILLNLLQLGAGNPRLIGIGVIFDHLLQK
jgi:hypothetical protein